MDAWWPRLAVAVMGTVLGVRRVAALQILVDVQLVGERRVQRRSGRRSTMPRTQAPPLADATKERICFGAFLGDTMRWRNRPMFQQVVVFRSHR